MARIASLGSALQDIYLIDHDDLVATPINKTTVYGHLQVGSKIDIDRISFEIGGGGINSAITFARHGHEAVFIGNISHDPAGEAIISALDKENIDSSYVNFLDQKSTGTSIILLDQRSGERTILTHRGASSQFNNFDEDILDSIRPDWLYVTSLRGDFDTLNRFFKKANSLGTRIMFNPGSEEIKVPDSLSNLFKYIDTLIVNQTEASSIAPGSNLKELIINLKNYCKSVIITAGAMGGIASLDGEIYQFATYEDKPPRDATGAGDAYGSGFLAHLASGKSFEESLIFASANSTSVVTEIGANKGILTGREPLRQMPIHKL